MFQLNLRMRVRPHHEVEAVQALRSITIAAQVEREFMASRILQSAGDLSGARLVNRAGFAIAYTFRQFYRPPDVDGDGSGSSCP
jgi:hypothetical protein